MYFRFSKGFFKTQSRLLRFTVKWYDRAPGSWQVRLTRRNPKLNRNLILNFNLNLNLNSNLN